jgi:Ca-activated chloride channel family protein
MRTGSPTYYLVFLAAIPVVVALLLAAARRRRATLRDFGDATPVSRITRSVEPSRRWWKGVLFACGVACVAFALVRPQFGAKEVLVKRRGIDVVFALDTSISMLARDLPPSRFRRAKQEISRILDRLGGDRVALIAFAGNAYVQCPFTLDYGAVRLFLENLSVGSAPRIGTNVESAIRRALELTASDEKKYKVLVIFTDGEALAGDALEAAREANDQGLRIFTVGVGTPAGEVIPVEDEQGRSLGVKRDELGEVVVTRLDEAGLVEVARATGGEYIALGAPGDPGAELVEAVESFEERELSSRTAVQFEEQHVWFSLAALLLLGAELILPAGRRSVPLAAQRSEA